MTTASDARLSQDTLARNTARLQRLIESLHGGVLVEDETRHIVLVNAAFCAMFNIPAPPSALAGADCSQSAEQSKAMFREPDAFVARIEAILRERALVTGELVYLRDGRVFSRDYVPVYHEDEYTGHMWHYRDVTAEVKGRLRAERLLQLEAVNRETVRLFLQLEDVDEAMNRVLALTGTLLDVSRVYVFRFRKNERLLDNTHEWCAPGVAPEIGNLQGLPFDDLFPSVFPLMAQHDLIAPRHIRELPDDLRGVLEPQDIQTVLWMPLYLDNRIEGFIGFDETRHERDWLPEEITMARVITESYARALERDQARRLLIEARDEAVRTAVLRSQFVANMSHEIRTPLTGTLGMLELLLETELDGLQREFASEAYGSSSRLLTIINDILDFSKLEAGQIVLEADPVDLKAIATEVKMTLAPQLKNKPVEIRVEVDSEVPHRVFGDATRLRQVLMNLAGNAVKFTREGEIVLSIRAGAVDDSVVALTFAVHDTGIGIAPENIERIFESFVQADGSTTRKFGGSGLGLSISRQLVELMGGSITVESTPGVGSAFSFGLQMPIAQSSGADTASKSAFASLVALVVDGNRTARYVIAQHLENWGVRVLQAGSLDDVEAGEQPARPDVVFLHGERMVAAYEARASQASDAPHVVYVTDRPGEHIENYPVLTWPIDQSSLYNTLMHVAHNSATPSPADDAAQWEGVTGRVLLVDDYPLNLSLVKKALLALNVQVDFVRNGQEALEQVTQAPYDLILMDMQMPVMSGIEATRRLRAADSPYRHIPILALTASVMRQEQERYLAAGVDAIVSKPFSVKHLREVVYTWLRAKPPAC
jgi:signal transduction histidine kinase/CheY-like chemotaxis protein